MGSYDPADGQKPDLLRWQSIKEACGKLSQNCCLFCVQYVMFFPDVIFKTLCDTLGCVYSASFCGVTYCNMLKVYDTSADLFKIKLSGSLSPFPTPISYYFLSFFGLPKQPIASGCAKGFNYNRKWLYLPAQVEFLVRDSHIYM